MKKRAEHNQLLLFAVETGEEGEKGSKAETRPNARPADKGSSTPAPPRVPKGLRLPPDICFRALTDWSLFPKLLTIEEAAWLTQVPSKTLFKWNSEGKLKHVAKTIGKHLRFDRDALLRMWCDEKKTSK